MFGALGEQSSFQRDLVVAVFDSSLNYVKGTAIYNGSRLRGGQNINVDEQNNVQFINQQPGGGGTNFFFSIINPQGDIMRQRKVQYAGAQYNHLVFEGGQRIGFKNENTLTDFVVNYFDTGRRKPVIEMFQFQNEDQTDLNCMGIDTGYFSSTQPFSVIYSGVWTNSITNLNNILTQDSLNIIVSDGDLIQDNLCTQI